MPQILNTRLLSPSLVRSLNPETYTFYCVYSEEEVNNWDYILEDNVRRLKHINICSNLDCQYYNRLTSLFLGEANNAQVGGPAVIAATAFGGMFFTGGLSLLALGVFSFGSLIAGAIFSEKNIKKTVKEIENELKEKWENELKEKWENERRNVRIGEEIGGSSQSSKQEQKK